MNLHKILLSSAMMSLMAPGLTSIAQPRRMGPGKKSGYRRSRSYGSIANKPHKDLQEKARRLKQVKILELKAELKVVNPMWGKKRISRAARETYQEALNAA